jgi:hypothetical protein
MKKHSLLSLDLSLTLFMLSRTANKTPDYLKLITSLP